MLSLYYKSLTLRMLKAVHRLLITLKNCRRRTYTIRCKKDELALRDLPEGPPDVEAHGVQPEERSEEEEVRHCCCNHKKQIRN